MDETRSAQNSLIAPGSRTTSRSHDEQSSTKCLPHMDYDPFYEVLARRFRAIKESKALYFATHQAIEVTRAVEALNVVKTPDQTPVDEEVRRRIATRRV